MKNKSFKELLESISQARKIHKKYLEKKNRMIKPKCYICKKELKEFGGLLIGPPDHDGKVDKKHICVKCYGKEFVVKIKRIKKLT